MNGQHGRNGRDGQDTPSTKSTPSIPSTEPRSSLIPKHGGYRKLKSFQVAKLVQRVTVRFCDKFINPKSRTHDQMVQAARSGAQNIAEGSMASGTSKKMELKLTNVARASLEELRLDYEDFLNGRKLPVWPADDPRRTDLIARRPSTADDVARWAKDVVNGQYGRDGRNGLASPSIPSIPSISSISYHEIAANGVIALIDVACSLLNRQLAAQAAAFESEGGFTERLYRVRNERRAVRPS